MTQFNDAIGAESIGDKSHGVRCNADGTLTKVYKPDAPYCVPCTSLEPKAKSPLITPGKEISPATMVSNMTVPVAACGLMDPGVDDNLQYGRVLGGAKATPPLFISMFPSWWYLRGVQSQVYVGLPNVTPEYFCVG